MRYFIGLDNGGTSTKAALFDEHGQEIGSFSVSTEALTPKVGFVERDMEDMWTANCDVVKGVLEKTGVSGSDVAGLGIAGHGKGLYLWGKDDKPVRNGIISTDTRAYAYPVKWASDGTEAKAFEYSLQHCMACQPTALLAWIRDNEPENYKNIKYVFECKDYVRFRLTGEARAEVTDYSGSGLMNLRTRSFDRKILELYGLTEIEDCLPPLVNATEIAGYVTKEASERTGLPEGTPVVGGMFDINACAIAAGVTDPDKICMIAGTWSINEYIRTTPVDDGRVQMNSYFALPGYYLIEESSPTSAGNLEWFVSTFLQEKKAELKKEGRSIYEEIDEWVEKLPPETFVPVFLPFSMASNVHPNARASFVGANVSHGIEHFARSVFEGITFCHRWHFERLMATRETPPAVIRLAGGAAWAAVWAQMFADVMKVPVETVAAKETGALGVAIGAAVATGTYPTLDEAIANMTVISGRYEPDMKAAAAYDKKYELYKKTIESLDGLWDDMQAYIESVSD
ncbi:MAG: carbohydrate kinase [Lachnospiraceae bacterium]|nr:carbohydrate kinase [Lachnospiraceae bacterium]